MYNLGQYNNGESAGLVNAGLGDEPQKERYKMAKKTDELVQFAGHFQSLATAVSRNLEERGVSVIEAIAEAAKPQGARAVAKIVDALVELVENGKRAADNTFHLVVAYAMSVGEMVAAGKYDWANSEITSEHFPVARQGKSEVEAKLVHLNRYFGSGDEVLRELDRMGYRPADLAEGLTFGATYPE